VKNFVLVLFIFSIIFSSCGKKGCTDLLATNYSSESKKDDGSCEYSSPIITLVGPDTIALCVGEEFSDPGFSSEDVFGTDLSSVVNIVNEVNNSIVGFYNISYSVTDINGNVSEIYRVIDVGICVSSLIGTYSVSHDCQINLGFTAIDLISESQSILAGSSSNEVIIQDFNQFITEVVANINGNNIEIPEYTFSVGVAPLTLDITISGSGTINSSGTEIEIDYNYEVPLIGPGSCIATYSK
jgi:hypothetical protein